MMAQTSWASSGNLLELDSLSQLLMENIDHNKNYCKLSPTLSGTYLNVLHAILDKESQKIDRKNLKEIKKWTQQCVNGCHCDFYLNFLDLEAMTPEIKLEYELIKKSSLKLSPKAKAQCLKNAQKLCSKSVFKKIQVETKDFEK